MKGKVVVITGAAGGIGQELTRACLNQGAQVCALCHNTSLVNSSAHVIKEVEVSDYATVQRALEACFTHYGGIDILVNAHGITDNARLQDMTSTQWHRVLTVNLTGVFHTIKAAIPFMREGNIVNIGSIVSHTGSFGCANYAAAKAGLEGLTRAAANELLERGVMVNLLLLGYIEAGMGQRFADKVKARICEQIPLKRFGQMADVVAAVLFLAQTRYMTGNTLALAGGLQ